MLLLTFVAFLCSWLLTAAVFGNTSMEKLCDMTRLKPTIIIYFNTLVYILSIIVNTILF